MLLTLEFRPSMATETKPSSETAPAGAAHFQVDEAYEYRAPKYFDFVADETEDEVLAAERWFEAGASHAPSRTHSVPPPLRLYRFVPPSFCLPSAGPRPLSEKLTLIPPPFPEIGRAHV